MVESLGSEGVNDIVSSVGISGWNVDLANLRDHFCHFHWY